MCPLQKESKFYWPEAFITESAGATATGGSGPGTRFGIAGSDIRYVYTALRSSSVILLINGRGIGGKISRPVPRCLPERRVLIKSFSAQSPIPVCLWGGCLPRTKFPGYRPRPWNCRWLARPSPSDQEGGWKLERGRIRGMAR